jgi:hypothetical protein
MKKLIFATMFIFLGVVVSSFGQTKTEIKVMPLGLINGNFTGGVEMTKHRVGLEAIGSYNTGSAFITGVNYEESGLELGVMGKFYFRPKTGGDGLYLGMFGKYGQTTYRDGDVNGFLNKKTSVGFMLGQKRVSEKTGFFLEYGIGVGRALQNENTALDGSSTDVSQILTQNLLIPGRIAIGVRF